MPELARVLSCFYLFFITNIASGAHCNAKLLFLQSYYAIFYKVYQYIPDKSMYKYDHYFDFHYACTMYCCTRNPTRSPTCILYIYQVFALLGNENSIKFPTCTARPLHFFSLFQSSVKYEKSFSTSRSSLEALHATLPPFISLLALCFFRVCSAVAGIVV